MSKRFPWLIIGAIEKVSLPLWDIYNIKCRVDTGATTSSLDVIRLEKLSNNRVRFKVALDNPKRYSEFIETEILREDLIKSSNGTENRIFIQTPIAVGPVQRTTVINLSQRKGLTYRMLLGRSLLSGLCLVDPSKHYLLSQPGGADEGRDIVT